MKSLTNIHKGAIFSLLIALLASSASYADAQGSNIIKNAGFENDTAHWELGNTGKYSRVEGGATSRYSVRGINAKYINFHQRSSQHVRPNTKYSYVLNYKIERNPDHQPIHFIVARGSEPWSGPYLVEAKVGKEFGANNPKWQMATGTFNSGDNTSIAVRVTSPSDNQTFFVDNFQVFETNAKASPVNTLVKQTTTPARQTANIVTGAFNANLYKGLRNNEVKRLQTVLNMPAKYRTGYYGPLTKRAVALYQKQNEIYPAVGYFGPKTRAYVNKYALGGAVGNALATTKQGRTAKRKTVKTLYAQDAHQARACKEHQEFKDWLGNDRGAVGEFGVSYKDNPEKHKALVDMFYTIADTYDYDTYAWATGEWWGNEYKVLPFSWDTASSKLVANDVSAIFKKYTLSNNANRIRGINLAGAEFALHNDNGEVGVNERGTKYLYHSKSKIWKELKEQGITHVRYPIRLERLFYNNGELRWDDWQEVKAAMALAQEAGIKVLIEPHNFGRMKIDGTFHTLSDAGTFNAKLYYKMMGKIADIAKNNDAIFAIGLMNEPEALGVKEWEKYSQGAVTAVRKSKFAGTIYVPTWNWQGIQDVTKHSKPWIKDTGKYVYEIHQYFDVNHSGAYNSTYDRDEATLKLQGFKAGKCDL